MNGSVLPHPVPHGLVDGLVPGHVAQDILIKDPLGLDLPLGFVPVKVTRQKTEIEH